MVLIRPKQLAAITAAGSPTPHLDAARALNRDLLQAMRRGATPEQVGLGDPDLTRHARELAAGAGL